MMFRAALTASKLTCILYYSNAELNHFHFVFVIANIKYLVINTG